MTILTGAVAFALFLAFVATSNNGIQKILLLISLVFLLLVFGMTALGAWVEQLAIVEGIL